MTLVLLENENNELIKFPYMLQRLYPGEIGEIPFKKLEQWTNDIEITMYWDGDFVYFEKKEDLLNFQIRNTWPPYRR